MNWILVICVGVGTAVISRYADRSPSWGHLWYGAWTVFDAALAIVNAIQRDWAWAIWLAVCAIIMGFWRWRNWRKRRKRTLALAGAKSRARLAKLVRRAREAATPRPVLQPVPRGTW